MAGALGRADQKALAQIAAEFEQEIALLFGLDAFRYDLDAKIAGHVDQRLNSKRPV